MEKGEKVQVKVTRCPEGVELEVLEWKYCDCETELDSCHVFSLMVKHFLNFALENKRGQISSEAVWGIF